MTARKVSREQALLDLSEPVLVTSAEQARELFGAGIGSSSVFLRGAPAQPLVVEFENPDPREKKRPYRPRKGSLAKLVEEAQMRVRAKQWDGPIGEFGDPDPRVLVGLYAASHQHVYRTAPEELQDPKILMAACSMARRFVSDVGSISIAVAIVRWTWAREHDREKRDPGRDFRVSFRYQFSKSLVTDFKRANKPRG